MGNTYDTVFGVFVTVPILGLFVSFLLNNFYPWKRLSDIAEVHFIKEALNNYVTKNKVNSVEVYNYQDYPCRKKKCCGLQYRESNPVFCHYLNTSNRFFGINDVILKDGKMFGCECFPPGRFEDFLYFVTNHNVILGMFFADIECNSTHSWRFGLLWFVENSFPFFLYAVLKFIVNRSASTDHEFVYAFTFAFMPIKFVAKKIYRCVLKSRVVIRDEEHKRRCMKACLCLKDLVLGFFLVAVSCLFYALAAVVATYAVEDGNETNLYFIGYYLLSSTFYSLLWLVVMEVVYHKFGYWNKQKYYTASDAGIGVGVSGSGSGSGGDRAQGGDEEQGVRQYENNLGSASDTKDTAKDMNEVIKVPSSGVEVVSVLHIDTSDITSSPVHNGDEEVAIKTEAEQSTADAVGKTSVVRRLLRYIDEGNNSAM